MVFWFFRNLLHRTLQNPENIDRLSKTPFIRFIARQGVAAVLRGKSWGYKFADYLEKVSKEAPKVKDTQKLERPANKHRK